MNQRNLGQDKLTDCHLLLELFSPTFQLQIQNSCLALKTQKTPFADSTKHSQREVVAASVFAMPLLQSNDPQFTDLQHSIYW